MRKGRRRELGRTSSVVVSWRVDCSDRTTGARRERPRLPSLLWQGYAETATQFGFLKDHGCDEAQGFLISKPLEANDLFKWWRMQEEENRIIGRQAEMWAHQRTA